MDLLSFFYGRIIKDASYWRSFNKWDEEWEPGGYWSSGENNNNSDAIRSKNFIPVTPNTIYYVTQNVRYAQYYNASKTRIGYSGENPAVVLTTADTYYIKICTKEGYGRTYKNDVCVNLAGEHNGTYVPHGGLPE